MGDDGLTRNPAWTESASQKTPSRPESNPPMPTPPPAPDFSTLYDFETPIETAFAAILKANGIANVYPSRDPNEIMTPAVVLRFVTGSCGMQRIVQGIPPRQVPKDFEGLMIAQVVTGRKLADAPKHGPFRGLVRYLFSPSANLINQVNMPWVQIVEFLPAGGTPQTTDEKELDRSELHFAMKFVIRDSAWPAPIPPP